MEEEPEEGSAHPTVGVDGLDHGGAHDELKRRAAQCVERRRELPTICRRGKEGQGKQAMQGPEAGSHALTHTSSRVAFGGLSLTGTSTLFIVPLQSLCMQMARRSVKESESKLGHSGGIFGQVPCGILLSPTIPPKPKIGAAQWFR